VNKHHLTAVLRNVVDVAVYCDVDATGRRGRRPARVFDHNESYQRVVRCKVIGIERKAVRRRRTLAGDSSREPEIVRVRVTPIGSLPILGPEPDQSFMPGVPNQDYYGRVEYLTNNRMIISTWDEFSQQLEAHLQEQKSAWDGRPKATAQPSAERAPDLRALS